MNTHYNMSAFGDNSPTPILKSYFKSPEGKYKLQCEKTAPTRILHHDFGNNVTKVTLAHLKDKPAEATPSQLSPSLSSISVGSSSNVRSSAMKLLGSGATWSQALSFLGGNGGNKLVCGIYARVGSLEPSSSTNGVGNSDFDGKGTYLVFNVGDAIFISDLNSQEKDPIKCIHFSDSHPICHSYDPDSEDGHDLLIGLNSGDVYLVSIREQLQDVGEMVVGAQHYNKDDSVNNSRCTGIAWIPNGDGSFVAAYMDGNMYVYKKNKDGNGDPSFSVIQDQTQFSVSHAQNSKNPVARWHICQGYLRVFNYTRERLTGGVKSYYGALLCCAWSADGKHILTGGEDDLVQVWSMEDRKIMARGQGHSSWVSGVAFDSYWSPPNSEGIVENVVYGFGSVGEDAKLLLFYLEMDELVVPIRRAPGGSPTVRTGNQPFHWDNTSPIGVLQPAPLMRDVLTLSPLVTHRANNEHLSDLIFTPKSVLTVCRERRIKFWTRPSSAESQSSICNPFTSMSVKEKSLTSEKVVDSGHK